MTGIPQADRGLFKHVSRDAVYALLGFERPVPLTAPDMARSLQVTFFPVAAASPRVLHFMEELKHALQVHGVQLLSYDEALADRSGEKLRENIVIIAPGELRTGDLPVDHVSNLRTVTIMGIVDGPCPADGESGLQEKLNSIVKVLAWNIVQVVVFVDDDTWTVSTMNGAIVRLDRHVCFASNVLSVLVPKLAAPVVPPHASDFDVREGMLDLAANGCAPFARDFAESGPTWAETGLMLFHTSLSSLEFRNRYYQRIAAAYLDHRSGMSYGFLARQLPVRFMPAVPLEELPHDARADALRRSGVAVDADRTTVLVLLDHQRLAVDVPDVWMLTTRSGCDKSNVDVNRDIVLMGLVGGRVILETPKGVNARTDCKPSYDTLTILAHAVGNAIVASVLERLRPGARFAAMLRNAGAALAHWHGLLHPSILPKGYIVHGDHNPPVSCSTHQSAIYALTGKLSALQRSFLAGSEFIADVHVEPYHGTNITGESLVSLARWVLGNIASHGVTRFSVQLVRSDSTADE